MMPGNHSGRMTNEPTDQGTVTLTLLNGSKKNMSDLATYTVTETCLILPLTLSLKLSGIYCSYTRVRVPQRAGHFFSSFGKTAEWSEITHMLPTISSIGTATLYASRSFRGQHEPLNKKQGVTLQKSSLRY